MELKEYRRKRRFRKAPEPEGSQKFGKIRLYAAKKVRKFMRRRRNKSGYGYKKYPDDYLYKKLGLYRDYRLSWTKASR